MNARSYSARSLSYACAVLVLGLGVAVLFGWRGNLGALHHLFARGPETRPVSGACLVALGTALLVGRLTKTRHLGAMARWLWAAACFGALALAAILLLQLFVMARLTERPASPHTVIAMVLIALSIAASFRSDPRWRHASVLLALAGAAIPWIALLGYATSVPFFYSVPGSPAIGMSIVSAVALLLLATGVMGLWPDHGFVELLRSRSDAGLLMRALLPAAVLFPIASGAFLNYGHHAGWFSDSVVLAVTLGTTSVIFIMLVLGIGLLVKRHEWAQEQAAAEREALLARLQDSLAQLQQLQKGLLTMCAWTRRVLDDGKWVEFEEFLGKRLKIEVTHGISAEAANELLQSLESSKVGNRPPERPRD